MGQQAATRLYVVDTVREDGSLDAEALDGFMTRMGAVLAEVGGRLVIEAQRVKVGELEGEPLAATVQIVGQWDSFSQLRELPGGATS